MGTARPRQQRQRAARSGSRSSDRSQPNCTAPWRDVWAPVLAPDVLPDLRHARLGSHRLPGAARDTGVGSCELRWHAFVRSPLDAGLDQRLAGNLHLEARARGIDLERPTGSMQSRIVVLAMCLALAPTTWLAAAGLHTGHPDRREEATTRAKLVAARLSHGIESIAADPAPSASELEALAERESSANQISVSSWIRTEKVAWAAAAQLLEQNPALLKRSHPLARLQPDLIHVDSSEDRSSCWSAPQTTTWSERLPIA